MELSAVGERVFAAESIIKRRIRKVASTRTAPHTTSVTAAASRANGPVCACVSGRLGSH